MASLDKTLPGIRLVSDPKFVVSDAWRRHIQGSDSPTPATFIVSGTGTIEWQHLPGDGGDWPTYAELTAALSI